MISFSPQNCVSLSAFFIYTVDANRQYYGYFVFLSRQACPAGSRFVFPVPVSTDLPGLTHAGHYRTVDEMAIEVGGKNMQSRSKIILTIIAADDIETGFREKIPLWLFGFLY